MNHQCDELANDLVRAGTRCGALKRFGAGLAAVALCAALTLNAQTAFTYQSKLTDGGSPAMGSYDLTFKVFDSPDAGTPPNNQIGGTVAMNGVLVTGGLFTVRLDFDAPGSTVSAVFTGARRWLQIAARTNNSPAGFVLLLPRTELTPTPYAIYAQTAAMVPNGAITPTMLSSSGALAGQTLTFNGSSVGWATSSGIWSLNGANAYYNGGNVGVGTVNPQARLHVNGANSVYGLFAQSDADGGRGVAGVATSSANDSAGVRGVHTPSGNYGILGVNSIGVYGFCANGNGVYGQTSSATDSGVYGESGAGDGVAGRASSSNKSGVVGENTGGGNGNGVAGYAHGPGSGIYGENSGPGAGVAGRASGGGTAVYGDNQNASGRAGLFDGRVQVNGRVHVFSPGSGSGANIPTDATVLASGDGFHNRFMSVNGNQAVYLSMYDSGYGEISTYDYGTGQGLPLKLNVNGGTVSVPVLEITGGADVAEPFQMSTKDIPKGALVTIDEANAGQVKMSDRAYDTRVAGILSGANGIKPGIQLRQEGALEGGQNVALSGRVYALADASEVPIKPGDLLTTSATPGHCMKVTDHARASGAIIGKAMSALEKGKGIVLVLVSLQ